MRNRPTEEFLQFQVGSEDVFCDWLSCYQEHMKGGLPVINNGCVAQFEANAIKQFYEPETGELKTVFDTEQIEWTTQKHFEVEGSFSTKIRIKCDGFRVSFDGNVSRFGRSDNVFGFSVFDCIIKANHILKSFGLPPFTTEKSVPTFNTKNDGYISLGCVITRVDLTRNYVTGSERNAKKLLHYLAGQDSGRRASAKQYGENGVTWNEGSKFWYSKAYLKSDSMGDFSSPEIAEWVKEQGIIRHEISLKSRYLMQKGLRHITDWFEKHYTYRRENGSERGTMENIVYNRFNDILTRGNAVNTPLEDIKGNIGRIARDWRSGMDVWGSPDYAKSTKRRWRKQLLGYGIDIKQPSQITRLPLRVEVIQLQQAVAPSWYWQKTAA